MAITLQTSYLKNTMGSDYVDQDMESDGTTFVLVAIEAPEILNNNITQVAVYVRNPGGPDFKTLPPAFIIRPRQKAIAVSCKKVGKDLWVAIATHSTNPAEKDAEGRRPIAIEKAVCPNVFGE